MIQCHGHRSRSVPSYFYYHDVEDTLLPSCEEWLHAWFSASNVQATGLS